MAKQKSTVKALLLSALSLVLCLSMLVGSTFAWFTDTASTGVNTITAGNLDVALQYSYDMTDWKDAETAADDAIFGTTDLWEPGFTKVVYFKVINNGSLDLKYKVGTNLSKKVIGKNKAGDDIDLTAFIQFGITPVDAVFTDSDVGRQNARAAVTPTAFANITTAEYQLPDQESDTFAFVAWMPEGTNNDANHNGSNVPSLEFGVNVIATQMEAELDSFGSDYDKDATYEEFAYVTYVENQPLALKGDTFEASIPANAGLKTEDGEAIPGNTELVMKVEELPAEEAPATIKVEAGQATIPYTITLETANGEKVKATTDVIEVELNIGAGRGAITLYHYDQRVPNTTYDAETGILKFTTTDFSPYTVVEQVFEADSSWFKMVDGAAEYTLYDAGDLMYLAELMNAGMPWYLDTKTFKLGADIDLQNVAWTPIGNELLKDRIFVGTFDGQGHTISNLNVSSIYDSTDSKNEKDRGNFAGLFGTAVNATIKNITIQNASVFADKGSAAVVAGYAYNSVIDNVTVIGDVTVTGGWQSIGTIVGWAHTYLKNGQLSNGDDNDSTPGSPTVTMTNIVINVNAGSKVECLGTGVYKDYVGGVWGRGIPKIAQNITSNIDVYATDDHCGLIGGYRENVATNATSTGTLHKPE